VMPMGLEFMIAPELSVFHGNCRGPAPLRSTFGVHSTTLGDDRRAGRAGPFKTQNCIDTNLGISRKLQISFTLVNAGMGSFSDWGAWRPGFGVLGGMVRAAAIFP
jgi:hypothetical protein